MPIVRFAPVLLLLVFGCTNPGTSTPVPSGARPWSGQVPPPEQVPVVPTQHGDWQDSIPSSHPRLNFSAPRWEVMKAYFESHPLNPSDDVAGIYESAADPIGNSIKYQLTKDPKYARLAITMAMLYLEAMGEDTTNRNAYNWFGEQAIFAFDWCRDEMTEAEASRFIAIMNECVAYHNSPAEAWGGPGVGLEANNYYWGYLRNSLMWGIASRTENTLAQSFINDAMVTRWQNSFVHFASAFLKGGIPFEGAMYGHHMYAAPLIPLQTVSNYGKDVWNEVSYFRESVFGLIYQSLPAPTFDSPDPSEVAENVIFGYGDMQLPAARISAASGENYLKLWEYGDFMANAAQVWAGQAAGAYARGWLEAYDPPVHEFVKSTDTGGATLAINTLPLDFFGSGNQGFLYTRSQWGPGATAGVFQLTSQPLISHEHEDSGSWQLWRNGVWLAREVSGYQGAGFEVPSYSGSGTTDISQTIAHNGLLIGGVGQVGGKAALAQVIRLESQPGYSYGVTDLSNTYPEGLGIHAEREVLFLRALETTVILDRVETAASSSKTFLMHTQTLPNLSGTNSYLSTNRDQAVRVTTLVPTVPSYKVVDEFVPKVTEEHGYRLSGQPIQSYRLQVETAGVGVQYLLHVVQARDSSAADLAISMVEDAGSWTVTLVHPTRGTARVVFQKGGSSAGGSVGYTASGTPVLEALGGGVQDFSVTNQGPVWGAVSN